MPMNPITDTQSSLTYLNARHLLQILPQPHWHQICRSVALVWVIEIKISFESPSEILVTARARLD